MSHDPDTVRLPVHLRIPGGQMIVELARFGAGCIPSAYIVEEPDDVSPARTAIRDQVTLLNALRKLGEPKNLTLLVDGNRSLHALLLPAHSLMTAPAASGKAVAA